MSAPSGILHIGCSHPNLAKLLVQLDCWADRVESVPDPGRALRLLELGRHQLLLIGPSVGVDAEALVEAALGLRPRLAVVVAVETANTSEALRLGRLGIAEYLPLFHPGGRPLESDWLVERLDLAWRAVGDARRGGVRATTAGRSKGPDPFDALIGAGSAMRDLVDVLRMIAPRTCTVLISGRTGSGKELAARAVHQASLRAARRMVAVNCGAVPASLMEAEFFGHVKGAFTGAVAHRAGRFEQAHGGTLFLDEVGELPLEMQSKLLRALQEKEIQRVGGVETIGVDVRVIAATNRDLALMVERGEFREDLYYRLNVVPVKLPSLCERLEDLPALAEHLVDRICDREGIARKRLGPEALDVLGRYDWPGNVRQLENAIDKAVALSGDRVLLRPSDFRLAHAPLAAKAGSLAPELRLTMGGLDFNHVTAAFERSLLGQALDIAGGNKKRAAELLRLKRTTFAARWKALESAA